MNSLDRRLAKLEAAVGLSEKKMKVGEFGYATLSEIRELMAVIAAKGPAFEMKQKDEGG